jgi:hypothetical protein
VATLSLLQENISVFGAASKDAVISSRTSIPVN